MRTHAGIIATFGIKASNPHLIPQSFKRLYDTAAAVGSHQGLGLANIIPTIVNSLKFCEILHDLLTELLTIRVHPLNAYFVSVRSK